MLHWLGDGFSHDEVKGQGDLAIKTQHRRQKDDTDEAHVHTYSHIHSYVSLVQKCSLASPAVTNPLLFFQKVNP